MHTQEVLTGSAGSVSLVLRISLQIKVMCSNRQNRVPCSMAI